MEQRYSNELQHHGIKGMKWGVRRTDAQLGHPSTTSKKGKLGQMIDAAKKRRAEGAASREAETQAKALAKAEKKQSPIRVAQKLDQAELKARIDRMKMEKEFATLMSERMPPKRMASLRDSISSTLGHIVSTTAKDVGTAYATKLLKDALDIPYKGKKGSDD